MRHVMVQHDLTMSNVDPVASALISQIRDSLNSTYKDFAFTCGGSIPIANQESSSNQSSSSASKTASQSESDSGNPQDVRLLPSPLITLRWDPQDPSTPASQCKLTFPSSDGQRAALMGLLRDMHPATFGVKGEEVYDESYRKASKLDTSRFSSSFNPYELGIVDAVAQLLLPNLKENRPKWKRGVRAELYKLNVYSGPSGHFRAHVDTPRSIDQFGSLVVCLPVAHTGGQLRVHPEGREDVIFDWGASEEDIGESPAIEWAAFYSDCAHEVLEVTSGHRITLTYNLYATYGGGAVTSLSSPVDMAHLSLYENLSSLTKHLESSKAEFLLQSGRFIGFHTAYRYPHTTNLACLPYTLKGLDEARRLRKLHRQEALVYPNAGLVESEADIMLWWSRHHGKPKLSFDQVKWLNEADEKKRSFADGYGNEPELEFMYCTCAIIAEVPYIQGSQGSKADIEVGVTEATESATTRPVKEGEEAA
ncbi:hypothetical protein RRF57_005185 [Xylaria bambusicola]|uniref:Fe2OG dioxygenase domain-containing protein n=1 Tax=Xylaria bambusicola TaxID=326684 RepID=A0AAN7UBZ3_9PEZI